MKRILRSITGAMMILSVGVGTVAAGEITGNGTSLQPLHANSECAFSGLDDADDDGFGRTQNWGQIPRKRGTSSARSASPPRTSAMAT